MCAYNYLKSSDSIKKVISFNKTINYFETYNENDFFLPQTNGEVSNSITQNWTQQAFECYKLNKNCQNCSIGTGHYSFVCQMGKIVDELLKTIGKPNEEDFWSD